MTPSTDSPRYIFDHVTNGANAKLDVVALGKVGAGGADTEYLISGFTRDHEQPNIMQTGVFIPFQNGDPAVVGITGVTNEAVVAVLIDRMRGFQSGPFQCQENACALAHLEAALGWFLKRTNKRTAAGVEGKAVPLPTEENPVDAPPDSGTVPQG